MGPCAQLPSFKSLSALQPQRKHKQIIANTATARESDLTTAAMESSPFATIPAELRNEIYSYLFELPSPIIIAPQWTPNPYDALHAFPPLKKNFTALAKTCRQLHQETTPIIYGQNKFMIRVSSDLHTANELTSMIKDWLNLLQSRRQYLKDVFVRIGADDYLKGRSVCAEVIKCCKTLFNGLKLRLELGVACSFSMNWSALRTQPLLFRFNHESSGQATAEMRTAVKNYYMTPGLRWIFPDDYAGECTDYLISVIKTLDQDPEWTWT